MNFRRLPFQFNSSNPVERQSELLRRFGVREENSAETSTRSTTSASGLSPRLQHRLPELFEKKSMKVTADNVDNMDHQPNVRVIPIQVESSMKDGCQSMPPNQSQETIAKDRLSSGNDGSQARNIDSKNVLNSNSQNATNKSASRVRNIPVVVERNDEKKPKTKSPKKTNSKKPSTGPCVSVPKPDVQEETMSLEQRSLYQISEILKEFQAYKHGVEIYSGDEKQYGYLDEMMVRSMLKLDGVETHGNEQIRMTRKAAIKEVQCWLDDLESKKNKFESLSISSDNASNLKDDIPESLDQQDCEKMDETVELQDSKVLIASEADSSKCQAEACENSVDAVVDSPMPEVSSIPETEVKCEPVLQSEIQDGISSQIVC